MDELEHGSGEGVDGPQGLSRKLDTIKNELRRLYFCWNAETRGWNPLQRNVFEELHRFQTFFHTTLEQALAESVSQDGRSFEIHLMLHDARNRLNKLCHDIEGLTETSDEGLEVKPMALKGLRETLRHLIFLSRNHELDRALKMMLSQNAEVVNLSNRLPRNGLKSAMLSRRLARVLHNLIQNSKKALERVKAQDREWRVPNYTRLSIQIEVSLNENFVEILVADNGPGLLGSDPFAGSTQEDGQTHGIGLTTSRELCRAVGGDLTALDDAPRGGARFLVRIPLLNEASAEPEGSHEE